MSMSILEKVKLMQREAAQDKIITIRLAVLQDIIAEIERLEEALAIADAAMNERRVVKDLPKAANK